MFDIGFWEILLIGVVALLVVGPKEFPSMIRNVAQGLGKMRGFVSSVKSDLDYEIDKANEIKAMVEKEAEIARLHQIIEDNAATVSVKGNSADASKGDESGPVRVNSEAAPDKPSEHGAAPRGEKLGDSK